MNNDFDPMKRPETLDSLATLGPSPELQAAIKQQREMDVQDALKFFSNLDVSHEEKVNVAKDRRPIPKPSGTTKRQPNLANRLKEKLERNHTHPRVKPVEYEYQVRTLPDRLGFGLFCPETDEITGKMKKEGHWYGHGGFKSLSPYAALRFDTTEAAKKFREKVNPTKKEEDNE